MTISIPDLEQRAALGWRAAEEERLGDWLLRAADGFTGRANSALATGRPGCPLDQAARAVRDWYQARGLPAMIAISYPAGRPQAVPLDGFLAGLGWGVRAGTATVMTAQAGQVAAAADWAGLTAIEVAPGHRRRGLATVITPALAAQAAAHGAGHVYLQVEDDNEPARILYRRIGFTAHHDYHYRIAPERQNLDPAPGTVDRPAGPGRPGGCG
jgi:ribosomal protein S18 acetylase RimI-like enzyme